MSQIQYQREEAPPPPPPPPSSIAPATSLSSSAETPPPPPISTPLPIHNPNPSPPSSSSSKPETATTKTPTPPSPLPLLRLELRDLSHPGTATFLHSLDTPTILSSCVHNVLKHLYRSPSPSPCPSSSTPPVRPRPEPKYHPPPTRSVTVILRTLDGVAYTTGLDLDPTHHKEIHLSLAYVSAQQATTRAAAELTGVLTHELVHCYQYDGQGACPGGLIEGVADWVRLRCGLAPPHWGKDRRAGGERWDQGYQHTAYFLEYLEERFGEGTVRRLNERLRVERYEERGFWTGLVGRDVGGLWEDYLKRLRKDEVEEGEREKVDGKE